MDIANLNEEEHYEHQLPKKQKNLDISIYSLNY